MGTTMTVASPSATVERITTEKAKALLEANVHNRNLRAERVIQLADAMRRGEWEINGETIKVAADGALLDGQHRLHAVVASGVAIDTLVIRGLPAETQDTIDTGRRRRLADLLRIEGHSDSHALGAALNVLHRIRAGKRIDYSHAGAPSPQQALRLINEVPEIKESVQVARRVTKEIGGPIGVFAALHCVFREVDPDPAADFFDGLIEGNDLPKGDPLLNLRNQIVRPRKDRGYSQSPSHIAALIIKAFNLRRAGQSVTNLSFRSNQSFPQIDPAAIRLEMNGSDGDA
jgi:hypothetical protein